MKISGAEAITLMLIHEGVELLFGYPGGAIMPTYDALYKVQAQLRHILVRHEQGAALAAAGYARMTKKPGVCLATSGPGATNLITGIADAMLDSIPLVCITGQVGSALIGTDAFQEADILSMTIPITKWNYQITCSKEIPEIMAKAFYFAQKDRPGPVLIDITKDAQTNFLDFKYPAAKKISVGKNNLDIAQIEQAAELINNAKKPLLFVGHGVSISGAEQEVIQLVEKSGMPVASTLLGLSIFPSDHQLYVGMLGMHGNYGPNKLTNEADLIVAVGMRFDDRVTGNLTNYALNAKIIHIEIDPVEINKNVVADVAIHADAKQALQKLLQCVKAKKYPYWLNKFKQYAQHEYDQVSYHEIAPKQRKIKMAEVVHLLSGKTKGQAVIVTDVGQHQMITARYYNFAQNNSHLTSGGLGTMGFALPTAIGAKLATPSREIIAIVGDGGFQMNIQELAVISQEKLKIKIIILNNNFLGMVRQWQELFFEHRYSQTKLHNPNFFKVAEAYGIRARKVATRNQLSAALEELLNAQEAYLLEVEVEQQENVFPMIPAGKSVDEVRLR